MGKENGQLNPQIPLPCMTAFQPRAAQEDRAEGTGGAGCTVPGGRCTTLLLVLFNAAPAKGLLCKKPRDSMCLSLCLHTPPGEKPCVFLLQLGNPAFTGRV